MEAIVCRSAVVVVVCLGVRDFAVDGVNYLVAPLKDSAALAKAIVKILAEDTPSVELRMNGLGTAASRMNEWMERVFLETLGVRWAQSFDEWPFTWAT